MVSVCRVDIERLASIYDFGRKIIRLGDPMIPDWFPAHPPIYRIDKDYAENAAHGPFFTEPIPKRPQSSPSIDFLGFKIRSPLGVPSGPLLTSRWIALAAKLGFDVVSYKTIRCTACPSHRLPNILFVEPTGPQQARAFKEPPSHLSQISITNSFGNPSKSPDFLLEDIAAANASLDTGQVMIVSVFGSTNQGKNLLDDFVDAALLAKTAGAKIIEANFSCPNVDKAEGCLYMSPDTVYDFAHRIAQAIHPIPLILKVGLFQTKEQMEKAFIAAAKGGARAIAGINTISMEVVDEQGKPALGPERKTSGICGSAIRAKALGFIRQSHEINEKQKLGLTLLGCGGIMLAEHFDEFLQAGAQIAMSATGMMWDPYLALRYHEKKAHGKSHTHSQAL